MNNIFLIGRLTRDPELRYVLSGQPVANFTLAVDRPFANGQGERETDFIDIIAWRKLAEVVSQHLLKGRLVALQGRLQMRFYETQGGRKNRVAEVVANAVRFLDKGKADVNASVGSEAIDAGDDREPPRKPARFSTSRGSQLPRQPVA